MVTAEVTEGAPDNLAYKVYIESEPGCAELADRARTFEEVRMPELMHVVLSILSISPTACSNTGCRSRDTEGLRNRSLGIERREAGGGVTVGSSGGIASLRYNRVAREHAMLHIGCGGDHPAHTIA
jgi:hypothetical protein